MRTTPKTIIIDRLAHALGQHGTTMKRDHLLSTAAYAFGYRNRETFNAAADAGELDVPAAEPVGTFDLPDGTTLIVVRDPVAGAPYENDQTFIESEMDARRERFGTSPYGHLLDVSGLADEDLIPIGREEARYTAGDGVYVATITNDKHDVEIMTATSWTGLTTRIAAMCRRNWNDGQFGRAAPIDDAEAVSLYFETVGENSVLERYLDDGSDETAEYIANGRSASLDAAKTSNGEESGQSMTRVCVDARSVSGSARFVIGLAGSIRSGEPMLWWSDADGYGSLCDATVYEAMAGALPVAGVDASMVGWYQLPCIADMKTVKTAVAERDIEFLTNREAEGGDSTIDKLRPYLRPEEIPVGERPGVTAALGYLARVDGETYFAPTIREWYVGSHSEALQANAAMAEMRDRMEPLVKRLGGFCMFDDDAEEGRVELTLFIPTLTVAGVDPSNWDDALLDLLGEGSETRIIASFGPQAMVLDSCIDVDPLGKHTYDVTFEVLLMGETQALEMFDHEADELQEAIHAPDWVRDWPGPFSISVEASIQKYYA